MRSASCGQAEVHLPQRMQSGLFGVFHVWMESGQARSQAAQDTHLSASTWILSADTGFIIPYMAPSGQM